MSAKFTVKYLGVELDHRSSEYIARNAISNINNKVKFLLRNSLPIFFNMKVKQMLTTALIQCHFDNAHPPGFLRCLKKQVKMSGKSCEISFKHYSQNACRRK